MKSPGLFALPAQLGRTALHKASLRKSFLTEGHVQLLVAHGASSDSKDKASIPISLHLSHIRDKQLSEIFGSYMPSVLT